MRVRRGALLAATAAVTALGAGAAVVPPTAVAAGYPTYTSSDTRGDAHSPPSTGTDGASDPRFDIRTVRVTRYPSDVYGVITFTDLKPASFTRYQFSLIGTNNKGGAIELREAAQGPPTVAYYSLRPGSQGTYVATLESCRGATMSARTSKNKISFDIPRRCFIGQGNRMVVGVKAAKWSESGWRPGRLRSYPGPGGAKTSDVTQPDVWTWG